MWLSTLPILHLLAQITALSTNLLSKPLHCLQNNIQLGLKGHTTNRKLRPVGGKGREVKRPLILVNL